MFRTWCDSKCNIKEICWRNYSLPYVDLQQITGNLTKDGINANLFQSSKKKIAITGQIQTNHLRSYPVKFWSTTPICKHILNYFEKNLNFLNHGFRFGYSCETLLLIKKMIWCKITIAGYKLMLQYWTFLRLHIPYHKINSFHSYGI